VVRSVGLSGGIVCLGGSREGERNTRQEGGVEGRLGGVNSPNTLSFF